jgi:murein DD-endopeptidase MepM/ murein hydrolase activator NlpD
MPLPLLGAVAGIGKALVVGTAKAAVVGAKVGAKAAVSSGKFFAKGGASLARGGAKVARQGGRQVVKGAKFFKKKVGGVKRKGGEISKKLKENATNLRDSLKKGNKNQDKLRAKGKERKKKKVSIEKKRGKEKELESKKSTSGSKKNILSGLAKSPLNILNKLFGLGGLLLGGILVNAAQGLIDKGKKFMEDNKELFDTIGNFLSGIKDAAVGLFDSFTGPQSEKGGFDDIAKFDDLGNLESGKLKDIENAYSGFGEFVNKIDKAMGGKGTVGNALIADKKVLAVKGGKEGVLNKTTDEFQEMKFTKEQRQRYEQTKSGAKPLPLDNAAGISAPIDAEAVDGSGLVVTSGMGMRGLALSPGMHMGVDIAGPSGTPLVAFTSGTLLDKGVDGGYGNYVVWTDDKGIEHFYAHLREPSSITKGSSLSKGQVIGLMGSTGRSSGPHLHWETSTITGDTGRSKSAVLSRFNPLSKYKKLDPFKIKKKTTESSSNGKGGGIFTPIGDHKNDMKVNLINQPMDDEGGETIFIQRVNNIQYIPIPVTA